MYRLVRAVVVIILASAGTLVAVASPALAAPPVFIWNNGHGVCLDQHYSASGAPDVQVFAVSCHWGRNQQWRMVYLSGNTFVLKNERNQNWCLSAPNGFYTQVAAELCTGAEKQVWGASRTTLGGNLLVSQRWGSCAYADDAGLVNTTSCNHSDDPVLNWQWFE